MTAVAHVAGPGWTSGLNRIITGRFPLAVERHAMREIGRLLPGVTTVTPHGRYYMVHGLVASEVERLDLVAADAIDLLRRVEVVMGAVSLAHRAQHPGMSIPHGGERIGHALTVEGGIDVAALAQPKVYAKGRYGFWGPYAGSERELKLVQAVNGAPRPGEHLDVGMVRDSLGDLLTLAERPTLSMAELQPYTHLCMCQGAAAKDGALLRSRLLPDPATVTPMSHADRRAHSIRLLLRLMDLCPSVVNPARDLSRFLVFDPAAVEDEQVTASTVYPLWTGVVLRSISVTAWRDLWAWLVNEIDGFMSVAAVGAMVADSLPNVTLAQFRADLPDLRTNGRLAPAEYAPQILQASTPVRTLSQLLLGAARTADLEDKVSWYFAEPSEVAQPLAPSWLGERAAEWDSRPVRDFAVFLTEEMVARSQRLALRKAKFVPKTGQFRMPTRLLVRDGHVYRRSRESGGGISLRWNTLTTVLAGAGLTQYVADEDGGGSWTVTDLGRST